MTNPKDDPNYVLKVEKAISEQYGTETVQHPAKNWTSEKEEIHLEQLKILNRKLDKISEKLEKVEVQGVLMSKKLLNKDSNRVCEICNVYSFDIKDDIYMNKYDCCRTCYIQWIEGREERWSSGWRPNKKEGK